MVEKILFLLFEIFYLMVKILPDRGQFYLGKGFGKLLSLLTRGRAKLAAENIARALGDKYSKAECRKIVKNVYANLGLLLVEFILLTDIDKDNFKDYLEIEGEEYLQQAVETGNGVILYGAHFGNWEWMAAFVSLLGYPMNALAQKQHNSSFNKKVNQIRESKGVNIIPLGVSVREAYRRLKAGEIVYILGDQDARHNGWKMDFFGRPASTFTGAVQLARRTGAAIVPAFLVRESWGKHRLQIGKPYTINKKASQTEQEQLLQELTTYTETIIRRNPEQWLWLHKRWKTKY